MFDTSKLLLEQMIFEVRFEHAFFIGTILERSSPKYLKGGRRQLWRQYLLRKQR